MQDHNTYRTTRLNLAAFLLAAHNAGFPEITRGDNGRATFCFNDPDGALSWAEQEFLADDYDGTRCMVSARRLLTALYTLKREMSIILATTIGGRDEEAHPR